MNKIAAVFSFLLCFSLALYAGDQINIIPYPQKMDIKPGHFKINSGTTVFADSGFEKLASGFQTRFKLVSGFQLSKNDEICTQQIRFEKANNLSEEGYSLSADSKNIVLKASTQAGMFYALQTLYQLMPVDIYGKELSERKKWTVPCVEIEDVPRFAYRGLHLDVSRHFFTVDEIKRYLDAMAIHKLNRFHWHLTDDQGWRIEIKKYPNLTKTGSHRIETLVGHYYENFPQRYDDDAYGGYYTQDEAREIVRYAAERNITVIPEIEMPGHASATIASYPFLSCTRQQINVAKKWGIFEDVYCTRDSVFNFLEDVLTEIMDIFPSEYIHIGGDECPKVRWHECPDCQKRIKLLGLKDEHELQSYFIQRIENFVNTKGRKIIGWDEILEGGLADNATVMSWRGVAGGIEAAKSSHNVIMTPGEFCYFDHYQDNPETEPTAIGGYTPLSKVYSFEPVPASFSAEEARYIIGAQANVWTEYLKQFSDVEYMVFPRIAALSEVLWTQSEYKNYDRFCQNMLTEFQRYKVLDINASKAFYGVSAQTVSVSADKVQFILRTDDSKAVIHYNLDDSQVSLKSSVYKSPVTIHKNTVIHARSFEGKKEVGKELIQKLAVSKISGKKPVSSVPIFKNDAVLQQLTDGIYGGTKSGNNWIQIGGNSDRELVYDLGSVMQVHVVSVSILNKPAICGIYPFGIIVLLSEDGVDFVETAREKSEKVYDSIIRIYRPEIFFPYKKARYVKIVFLNGGNVFDLNGNTRDSVLFLDEIEIN
ncbi:MAG: family 20 glycosylhydrolase [Paludibacter sp.]|nr:family 20 glycosylhydrolase [Paludibacter sp.]